jgi:transposase
MLERNTQTAEKNVRQRKLAAGPRRGYSLDFKLKVLEETFAPDASVAAVALRHNMNTNVIFRWRKLFREGRLRGETGQKLLPASAGFVPVEVVADEPLPPVQQPPLHPEKARPSKRGGRGMMEITLRCGVVIRVGADVDDGALARVVAAVGDGA